MPQDLSNFDIENIEITEEQKMLLVWKDYFNLLIRGIDAGSKSEPWSEDKVEIMTWLSIACSKLESDAFHKSCEQEEYCAFDKVKDLTKIETNRDVRE